MPIPSKPKNLLNVLGVNAEVNDIPETTKDGTGAFSYESGFPPVTSQPLTSGGIPPSRGDFNAVIQKLSQHTFYQQSGSIYVWDEGLNYLAGAHVLGTDGTEYIALKGTGPDTDSGAQNPVSVGVGEYWMYANPLETPRTLDGVSFDGTDNVIHYGECSTSASTKAKAVACNNFTLATGARIIVKFTVTNTAASPTLNVNKTGAKAIYYKGSAITAGYLASGSTYEFVYNGSQYELIGDVAEKIEDTNVTQTINTSSNEYPILLTKTAGLAETETNMASFASGVTVKPTTGRITAGPIFNTFGGYHYTFTPSLTKGDIPTESIASGMRFCDTTRETGLSTCFGQFYVSVDTEGTTSARIYACENISGADTTDYLGIFYPKGGTAYTRAPNPEDADDNSKKIATTKWVQTLISNKTDDIDSAIETANMVPNNNSWVSRALGSEYTAGTNGYLVIFQYISSSAHSSLIKVTINNTTKEIYNSIYGSGTIGQHDVITIPLKSGDSYKVENNSNASSSTISWVPAVL